jgi:hypothetical protein
MRNRRTCCACYMSYGCLRVRRALAYHAVVHAAGSCAMPPLQARARAPADSLGDGTLQTCSGIDRCMPPTEQKRPCQAAGHSHFTFVPYHGSVRKVHACSLISCTARDERRETRYASRSQPRSGYFVGISPRPKRDFTSGRPQDDNG